MKKPDVRAELTAGAREAIASDLSKRWPTLWEYLSSAKWDDGSVRETSTLMLLVDEGRLKGCLNDRALERSCWVAADSLMGLLESLEAALESGGTDWRARKEYRKKK